MFSKSLFEILGLKLNVYGFDEYKALPEHTPLSAMFFCHGFGQTQETLEKYCQKMCQLNQTRSSNDRYLIIISLDHPNAGTRKVYNEAPFPKKGTYKNQDIIFKMYLLAKSTAHTISSIIECFDIYAFGTESKSFVEKWGCVGHSMGAITAELLPTFEPKISTVIMISSCLRVDVWIPYYTKALGLEVEFYAHKKIKDMMTAGTKNAMYNLRDKHLLILYGEKERTIPKGLIHDTLNELRMTQEGIEGYDWKCDVLPESKHELDDAFVTEAMKWTKKWMLLNPTMTEAKILANL